MWICKRRMNKTLLFFVVISCFGTGLHAWQIISSVYGLIALTFSLVVWPPWFSFHIHNAADTHTPLISAPLACACCSVGVAMALRTEWGFTFDILCSLHRELRKSILDKTHNTHKHTLPRPTVVVNISLDKLNCCSALDSATGKHQRDFGSVCKNFPFFSTFFFFQFTIVLWWITWLGSVLHNALQWLWAVQWLACRMRTEPLSTTGRHATLELHFLLVVMCLLRSLELV